MLLVLEYNVETVGSNRGSNQTSLLKYTVGYYFLMRKATLMRNESYADAAFLDFAFVPSRKPFRNFRWTVFMYRIRPVPVVFRLIAFLPQLYVRLRACG